jgi:hypothetical protein
MLYIRTLNKSAKFAIERRGERRGGEGRGGEGR